MAMIEYPEFLLPNILDIGKENNAKSKAPMLPILKNKESPSFNISLSLFILESEIEFAIIKVIALGAPVVHRIKKKA